MTPPTPIDPDLVELRCKLRGWQCERAMKPACAYPDGDLHDTLVAFTPNGRMWFRADDWGGDDFSNQCYESDMAAPRLTLADIIADPGEGWTARVLSDDLARFDHADATVWFGAPTEVLIDDNRSEDLPRMIAAARAVTDLLIRLAEVEPRA